MQACSMLSEITEFVNWVRRRNPEARTWRDYQYDLQQFAALVGDRSPSELTFKDIDRFVDKQVSQGFQAGLSSAAWRSSWPCTPSSPTKTQPWSARSCPTATTCASRSACPARCRKTPSKNSSLRSQTPATGPCSC